MSGTEGAPLHGKLAHLLPPGYKRTVSAWLEEDAPSFDYGGFVVGEDPAEAKLLGKSKVCNPAELLNFCPKRRRRRMRPLIEHTATLIHPIY
jgi:hypothetical protein